MGKTKYKKEVEEVIDLALGMDEEEKNKEEEETVPEEKTPRKEKALLRFIQSLINLSDGSPQS